MEEARQHTSVKRSKRRIVDAGWDVARRLTFSHAVKKGNMLFLSGLIGKVDEKGKVISVGDIAAQTREIYEKVAIILEKAGATFDDVVKTTDYVTTFENYKYTADVRREFFGEPFPAATGILVSGLLRKDALIEIDVIAILDK